MEASAQGVPQISGLVNTATGRSASSVPVAARGSQVSILGANLAAVTLSAPVPPLSNSLGGTQVFVGGIAAPILMVSPGQVDVQVPFELPDSLSFDVVVRTAAGDSAPLNTVLLAQDPGIFSVSRQGAAVSSSNPILSGDAITIYATGLGAVMPFVPSGQAAPASPLAVTAIPAVVKVAGQIAQITFAGLAPQGSTRLMR